MFRVLLTIGSLQLLTMAVLFARTKALALLLGPEQLGVLGLVDRLLAVYAQTASFSIPFAALRFLPDAWRAGESAYQRLFRPLRNVLLATVGLATAIGLTFAAFAPRVFGNEFAVGGTPVFAGFLTLPALALLPFIQSVFGGTLRHGAAMRLALFQAVLLALASILGWLWRGLDGIYITSAIVGAGLALWALRTLGERDASQAGASLPWFRWPRRIWRFCCALLLLSFLAPYGALAINYEVLQHHGRAAAGWLASAVGISIAMRGVLGAAHSVFLTPEVNRAGSPTERMARAERFHRANALLAGVLVPPLLLVPDLALRVLYSGDFVQAREAVMVFVLAEVCISGDFVQAREAVMVFVLAEVCMLFASIFQSIIVAEDRLRYHVAQNAAAQILLVGTAMLLIPRAGLIGAGIAALAAPLLLSLGTALHLKRAFGLSFSRSNLVLDAWILLISVGSGLAGLAVAGLSPAILAAKAGVAVMTTLSLWGFLSPSERQRVREITRRLRAD